MILFFARIFVLFIICLSNQLFIHGAISAQSAAAKKLSFLTMDPAKTTIRIGEIATFKLIANYDNGNQEIVKTGKFRAKETGVFPVISEYEGEKTSVLAKVFVIENKEIEDVFFRPNEIAIELGDTAVLDLLARFKDGSEGAISTEEFVGSKLGTFPLSSSFEEKKTTATITVKDKSFTRIPLKRGDYPRCPRLQPCSDCHAS